MTTKQILHKTAIKLREAIKHHRFTGMDQKTGLCYHLAMNSSGDSLQLLFLLRTCFKSWKHYSGDINFPVPSPTNDSAQEAYCYWYNKYSGEYGELRLDLLDHIIKKTA